MGVTQLTTSAGLLLDGIVILNGTIDLNGTAGAIILDSDGDTTIGGSVNNTINITVGGSSDFTITANSLNVLTGSTIAGPSSTFTPFVPIALFQSITGAGAINVTTYATKITTTGADAFSLADGVVKGQLKKIYFAVDGGDATVTPTNLDTYTTITFGTAGQFAILMFNGTDWVVIDSGSDAAATGGPVLA